MHVASNGQYCICIQNTSQTDQHHSVRLHAACWSPDQSLLLCTCSVHERFCMAAARADQVAETGSSKQPAAPSRQASDAAPGSAIVTHTAAPGRPANSGPQDRAKEASCSQEGTGMLDSLCSNSPAATAADGLTASTGSQISRLQAGDSALEPAEETDPQASRQEDEGEETANPTTSQAAFHCSENSQAPPWYHNEDSIDPVVTDTLEGPSGGGKTHGGASVSREEGRSQRPARTPLAAVQEAVTPMLGSLSFKQAVHGKQSHGKLWCLLPACFVSCLQARLMKASYIST